MKLKLQIDKEEFVMNKHKILILIVIIFVVSCIISFSLATTLRNLLANDKSDLDIVSSSEMCGDNVNFQLTPDFFTPGYFKEITTDSIDQPSACYKSCLKEPKYTELTDLSPLMIDRCDGSGGHAASGW